MSKGILFDSKICIGCGACSAGCKETHQLSGEPRTDELDADNYTIVKNFNGVFIRKFCRHCVNPSCASACPVGALQKTKNGPVVYDARKCIGCRYCFIACPYGIPRYQWSKTKSLVRKCDLCAQRLEKGQPTACAEICPTGATKFGEREDLLKEAKSRIESDRQGYFQHVWGDMEVGGSSVMFIADRDLKKFEPALPTITKALPDLTKPAMNSVPVVGLSLAAVFTGIWWLFKRRNKVAKAECAFCERQEYIRQETTLSTGPKNLITYALLAIIFMTGIFASWVRFSKGLGTATNLSDAVPWGLWIWFFLSRVAISAGGFIFCALYYIFHIKKFKPIIRAAVLTAFVGYGLAGVELIYDLGLPLHFWHPAIYWNFHSAMFETSVCIALYIGILAMEISVPLTEGLGLKSMTAVFKKFLVVLAIVGTVLSTLHQSSLGSLFLLTPDKLSPLWYSSWLPFLFFASALSGGLGFLILELFLAEKFLKWDFPKPLAKSLGKILLGMLVFYFSILAVDFIRSKKWLILGQDPASSGLFALETGVGVLLPIVLLSFQKIRDKKWGLRLCASLSVAGLFLNRLNVILLGFLAKDGAKYFPSWQELAITIMMLALGVSAFVLFARNFPIFEKSGE